MDVTRQLEQEKVEPDLLNWLLHKDSIADHCMGHPNLCMCLLYIQNNNIALLKIAESMVTRLNITQPIIVLLPNVIIIHQFQVHELVLKSGNCAHTDTLYRNYDYYMYL